MSQFIESYLSPTQQKKTKMKIYTYFRKEQWAIHILPTFDLYVETHSPLFYEKSWKNGITGLYLEISWLAWSMTIGGYKRFK